MKKVIKNEYVLDGLKEMAKEYGVENNQLFLAAANQYALQQIVIDKMRKEVDKDELTTEKTYVKGRANLESHPIIKELPRHTDAANKTAQTMLDIIVKIGQKKAGKGKLAEMLSDD